MSAFNDDARLLAGRHRPVDGLGLLGLGKLFIERLATIDSRLAAIEKIEPPLFKHVASRWSGFATFARRAPYASGALIILVALCMGFEGWQGLQHPSSAHSSAGSVRELGAGLDRGRTLLKCNQQTAGRQGEIFA
jgi:hypothetical protein